VFTVGPDNNQSGFTYVVYLFAHNAGGFGTSGNDNVISCGSYTGNGSTSGPVIDLGYEPQWLLVKGASSGAAFAWTISDNMRGIPMSGDTPMLFPNNADAESAFQGHGFEVTATGFKPTSTFSATNASGQTYIYIAIRRGPMKTPTTGTSVFNTALRTTGNPNFVAGFPVEPSVTIVSVFSIGDVFVGSTFFS
jgi:hypothetical protein